MAIVGRRSDRDGRPPPEGPHAVVRRPAPADADRRVWYADDFLGEPLSAVKSTYRDLGVEPSDGLREEPDHAAVELAALEMLARDGADGYR